jgi:hypothetical protein
METIVHFLAIYGLTFGLMNDKVPVLRLLRKVGFFDRMFKCSYCTGFHSGWIVRLALDAVVGPSSGWWASEGYLSLACGLASEGIVLLTWGFAGSTFCYVADQAIQWLESRMTAGR